MTILPPLFFYIFLRKNRVSILISFIIAFILLVSYPNVVYWTKVSHFALVITLIIFILISYLHSLFWASFFASIGSLLVSYVRPEYFLAFLSFTLLFFLIFFIDFRKEKKFHLLIGLIGYTIISSSFLCIFEFPITNRSFFAFGQHFALNWVTWTGSNIDPSINWEKIVSENFGSVNSIWGAFISNPYIFLKHIIFNLGIFLIRLPYTMIFPPIYFSDQQTPTIEKILPSISVIFFIGVVLTLYFRKIHKNLKENWKEHKIILIITGIFSIPGIISSLIIRPERHYLIIPYVLISGGLTILLNNHIKKQTNEDHAFHSIFKQLLLLSSFIIAITPSYFATKYKTKLPNLEIILFIQSLRIEEPINIIDYPGFSFYANANFHRIGLNSEAKTNFVRFLNTKNIQMIIPSPELTADISFKDEWQNFLKNYQKYGFVQIEIPNNMTIFIKSNLLHK